MKPILKTVTQEFDHELKSITYAIVRNSKYNDIRIKVFENGNFVNEIDTKNISDAKKKVSLYSSKKICLFTY